MKVCSRAKLSTYKPKLPHPKNDFESSSDIDGTMKGRYSSYYEPNPFYRTKAI
jgi:hypothetical protein